MSPIMRKMPQEHAKNQKTQFSSEQVFEIRLSFIYSCDSTCREPPPMHFLQSWLFF